MTRNIRSFYFCFYRINLNKLFSHLKKIFDNNNSTLETLKLKCSASLVISYLD